LRSPLRIALRYSSFLVAFMRLMTG